MSAEHPRDRRDEESSKKAMSTGSIVPANGAAANLARHSTDNGDELGPASGSAATQSGAPRQAITPRSLWRYKGTIAAVFCVAAGISVPAVWTTVRPQFSSTAKVRVAPVIQKLVYDTGEQSVPVYSAYLNSQVSLITSSEVVRPVLEREDVKATEWYRTTPFVLLGDPPTLIERLNENLMVVPLMGTELIDVTMMAENPKDAALIVNALVDQYQALCDGVLRSDEQKRSDTLEDELKGVQREIGELIDAKYRTIDQAATGLPPELRTALSEEMKRLNLELTRLESGSEGGAPGMGDAASGLMGGDPLWLQLKAQVDASRLEVRMEQHRLGEDHPRMKGLLADLREKEDALGARAAQMGFGPVAGNSKEATERRREELKRLLSQYAERSKQATGLERDLAMLEERLADRKALRDDIRRRLQELHVESKAPGRVSIASAGLVAARPSQDRRVVLSLFALVASALLGISAACLRISGDSSIHEIDDVTRVTRDPFLGQLPYVPNALAVFEDPRGGLTLRESVRMVRTALLQRVRGGVGRVLVVTSPGASAGKTTLSVMLGRSLAQLGKRVLLVDADFARPELSRVYGGERPRGLRSLLAGRDTHESVIVPTGDHGFDLLPAGLPVSANDAELLANGSFHRALEHWRGRYELVLIDGPPVLAAANAGILASQVDGALFVLRASHSRRSEAMRALATLSAAGARLIGTVLVGATDPTAYYSSNYYRDPKQSRHLAAPSYVNS